ncbi:MAG: amino acid ABC transporter substrate-binding protein [Anaerolineae bacterium]|nr:amino acid ABC transporter substrate-binding protein [Anaerolineae bacterium]
MAAAAHRLNLRRWHWIAVGLTVVAVAWLLLRAATEPQGPLLPTGALRVGVDPSNPPFAFFEDDQIRGLEIDLANALGEAFDVPVQLVPLGFDGLYDAIKVEGVDIVIAAITPDPLRTADVNYSLPYYDNGLVLVSPAQHPIAAMDMLSGSALAYPFGSEADTEAHRWLRRIEPFEMQPYETPQIALDAVRLGAADAALTGATDARLYARAHEDWPLIRQAITHTPFVIATGAKHGRLAAIVDDSLRRMQSDGTLDALVARWLDAA